MFRSPTARNFCQLPDELLRLSSAAQFCTLWPVHTGDYSRRVQRQPPFLGDSRRIRRLYSPAWTGLNAHRHQAPIKTVGVGYRLLPTLLNPGSLLSSHRLTHYNRYHNFSRSQSPRAQPFEYDSNIDLQSLLNTSCRLRKIDTKWSRVVR